MDTHVIYDNHLQIVANRKYHELLKATQKIEYPPSKIVTPAVLQLFHDKAMVAYIDRIRSNHADAVCYILESGTYGAQEGYHCNGIRFGELPQDYVSLPQIKLTGE